jgi:hypothetical protein
MQFLLKKKFDTIAWRCAVRMHANTLHSVFEKNGYRELEFGMVPNYWWEEEFDRVLEIPLPESASRR